MLPVSANANSNSLNMIFPSIVFTDYITNEYRIIANFGNTFNIESAINCKKDSTGKIFSLYTIRGRFLIGDIGTCYYAGIYFE